MKMIRLGGEIMKSSCSLGSARLRAVHAGATSLLKLASQLTWRARFPLFAISLAAIAAAQPAADLDKRLADIEKAVKSAQSAGDNAWMLTSAALVLMMTGPGLALFYGGLVRRKNV